MHGKTGEENWIPLFNESGVPFFPVLMAELDAIKGTRIAGLMLRRDWGKHDPWPTFPKGMAALQRRGTVGDLSMIPGSFGGLQISLKRRNPQIHDGCGSRSA